MSEEKKTPQPRTDEPPRAHEDVAEQIEAEKQELYEKQDDVFKRMSAYDGQLREDKKVRALNGKNAILAAMLVLVVAVALVFIIPALLPEQQEEEESSVTAVQARTHTFSNRKKEEVVSVTLHQDGEVLHLSRNVAGDIVASEHPEVKLNQTNAGSVFFSMANLSATDTVQDDSSRAAEFGLENPDCYAEVTYDDGSQATYYLGNRAPNGTSYYFKAEGDDAIYLVAVSVNTYMRRTLQQLRTLQELPEFDFDKMDQIRIRTSEGELDMRQNTAGAVNVGVSYWTMFAPYQCGVDGEALTDLQESLATLKIESYVGEVTQEAEYGLDEANAVELYLHDTDGNEITATIGTQRNSTEYYARFGDDTVYIAGYEAAKAVREVEPLNFVDSFAAIVNISYVDSMQIHMPDGQLVQVQIDREEQYDENHQLITLTNGEPKYLETYTVNGKVYENDPFKEMYQAIIGVTIDGLVETDETGAPQGVSGEDYVRIVYRFNNDLPDMTVEYRPYKSLYYAVNKGGDFYFYVSASKLESALKTVTDLIAQ